jgi:hypothetical protein
MECRISLAPELGVNAFVFITAWNQMPACRAAAEARLAGMGGGAGVVFDPSRLRGHTAVLNRLASNVDAAALHALLERALRHPIQVREEQQADGARLLTVSPA